MEKGEIELFSGNRYVWLIFNKIHKQILKLIWLLKKNTFIHNVEGRQQASPAWTVHELGLQVLVGAQWLPGDKSVHKAMGPPT